MPVFIAINTLNKCTIQVLSLSPTSPNPCKVEDLIYRIRSSTGFDKHFGEIHKNVLKRRQFVFAATKDIRFNAEVAANSIQLVKDKADRFVPDGASERDALTRTTHLAIGAHQDDLEIFAFHGISECFEQDSKWFTGIVVSDGAGSPRKGKYENITDDQMTELRREEQRQAARIGKYSAVYQLSYPSSEIKDRNIASSIERDLQVLLEAAKPEVVYIHNPADRHDTHVAVFLRSLNALRALPKNLQPKQVWGCEVWRDLDWLDDQDRRALGVSKHEDLALKLCAVFDSQVSGGKRYDLATVGRRTAHATYSSSHETDKETGLTLALDIMPLLKNPSMKPSDFLNDKIKRFENDVKDKLGKF